MGTRSLRQLTTVGAVALTALATAAACTAAPVRSVPAAPSPASPSPASPSTTSAGSATPSSTTVRAAASRAPAPSRPTTRPTRCLGAVKYTIDAAQSGPPRSRLCIAVGGVVEVRNLGPDGLSVSPASKVSCSYEAGVHACRLVRPGTVTFTIAGKQARSLVVVAIR